MTTELTGVSKFTTAPVGRKNLELIFVDNVDEVLKIALTKPLIPIEWDEQETIKSSSDLVEDDVDQDSDNPITH